MEVRSIRAAGTIFHVVHAHVAQLDEYEITNLGDAGSSPAVSSIFKRCRRVGSWPVRDGKAEGSNAVHRRTAGNRRGGLTRSCPHFLKLQGIGEPGRPCLPWKEETGGSNPPALTIF